MTAVDLPLADALRDRYVIERELGRGGMATVYLARDLRHRRHVALKVLHPELSAMLGSERFLQEIELTAHLQHPHILPLFDSGQVDRTVYYVMPFVEGESLRQRLTREKQLPVGDAVRIAGEVASALDYAHRRGIIHRDVKPENILLQDGTALVADFGIALAASNAGRGARMTETGLSLGTPHYMSPEQAMGERELTARSDVYALGAVAYEMLVGSPPFVGPTAQAVVAKVLTEEPPAIITQRRSVPENVEAAILTALEKLPADRFATAAEFAAALAADAPTMRRPRRREPTQDAQSLAMGVRRWRAVALSAAALAVIAAGMAAWAWAGRPDADPPATRRAVLAVSGRSDPRDNDVAVSADGRTIAMQDAGQVVVRRADQIAWTTVPGGVGADAMFLSPDGTRIGFRRERELVVQRLDGGDAVTVPFATAFFPAYGGEGRVVAVDSGGLVLLDLSPSRRDLLLRESAGTKLLDPHLPPGGRHVLVAALTGRALASARILAVDLRSRRVDTLLDGGALRPQVADGRLYFARPGGALHAVGYDLKNGRTVGPVVPTGDVAIIQRTGRVAFAAGAGLLVYGERPVNQLIALAPGGRRDVLTSEPSTYHNPRVSPDGRRIVLDRDMGGQNGRDVWILDLEDGALSRVTFKGDAHDAVWTPDGRRVTYVSLGTPGGPVFTTSADGAGGERAIALPGRVVHPGQWLADARAYVAGISDTEEDPSDIVILPDTGGRPEPLVTSRYNEHSPAISPDGRWLAYVSDETGRRQVYIRPLRGGGGRTLVSEAIGDEPVWSRDGRQLYYVEHRGTTARLITARIEPGVPPRVLSRTVAVEQLQYEPVPNHPNWDVAPDGRMIFIEPLAGSRLLMVSHWAPPDRGVTR